MWRLSGTVSKLLEMRVGSGRFLRWKPLIYKGFRRIEFQNFILFLRVFLAFSQRTENSWDIRRAIEEVITRTTRNRVGRFPGWPHKPLILRASSAFLHFFKTEYLRFFYALSTISTPGSQSAGNPQSLENTAWRCIEVVVTRLTRNRGRYSVAP